MGLSKTEINLKRLLATAPHQKDQAKLIHVRPDDWVKVLIGLIFSHVKVIWRSLFILAQLFLVLYQLFFIRSTSVSFLAFVFYKFLVQFLQYVTTLREQLEQLAEERTPEGLSRLVCFIPHFPIASSVSSPWIYLGQLFILLYSQFAWGLFDSTSLDINWSRSRFWEMSFFEIFWSGPLYYVLLVSLCRVSKALLGDYSEKIEAIASKLAVPLVHLHGFGCFKVVLC